MPKITKRRTSRWTVGWTFGSYAHLLTSKGMTRCGTHVATSSEHRPEVFSIEERCPVEGCRQAWAKIAFEEETW